LGLPPFDLEDWLIKCRGAKINLDHSGAPSPYKDGFDPSIDQWDTDDYELEERLAELIASTYGVEKDMVALCSGAQNANYLAFRTILKSNDLVAIESPTYMPIRVLANSICGVFDLNRDPSRNFHFLEKEIEECIKRGAKAIVFTNLHNPSASSFSNETLMSILEITSKKGIVVVCDEIYREMHYGVPPDPVAALNCNAISISGLTKLFGLGDLRIGWALAPPEIASRINLLRLYVTYRLPARSVAVAIEAIKRRDWFRERMLRIAMRNLTLLKEWLEEENRISCRLPHGGLMALFKLPEGIDDMKFSEYLLERFFTAVCPGRYFGIDNHVRVTFSCDATDFRSGLENISMALDKFCV
jgi:aspartate/methionine/tyrosine aminotransferase